MASGSVSTTIYVGNEPATLNLKPDQSSLWVANFGSNTVSEINLSTNSVGRTAAVNPEPAALAYDQNDNALWVGGNGYIQEINLASFTVAKTIPVSGNVTSLAYSAGQNELIYTMLATGQNSGSIYAQEFRITDSSVQGTHYAGSEQTYSTYSLSGSLPIITLLSSGSMVSASYNNALSIVSTPSGFLVIDLAQHSVLMEGSTPTPIRGIATDAAQDVAYLTLPESNGLIEVPMP